MVIYIKKTKTYLYINIDSVIGTKCAAPDY